MSFFVAPVSLYGELAFSIAAFSGKLPKYTAAVPRLRSVHPSTTRESKWRYIMKKVNLSCRASIPLWGAGVFACRFLDRRAVCYRCRSPPPFGSPVNHP